MNSTSSYRGSRSGSSGPDRLTLAAFVLLVVIGGSNAVAVRLSNVELPPFWGAGSRFFLAALIFWGIVLVRRISLPGGRALAGTLLYGALTVGISYALLYWALQYASAGLTMVVLACVPLLTFFFALIHRLEPFRWRSLVGALLALAGILLGASEELGGAVPTAALLALIAAAACIAEGSVIFKLLPKSDPLSTNALALTIGAAMLLGLSILTRETMSLPATISTWAAFLYLVLIGSVILFYLYLYVLGRWTASATAYSFLLFPVATVLLAAWLVDEAVTPLFLLGGMLVLAGVWIGAINKGRRLPETTLETAGEKPAD